MPDPVEYFADHKGRAAYRVIGGRGWYATDKGWVEDGTVLGTVSGVGGDGEIPVSRKTALALLRSLGGKPDELDRSRS